MVIDNFEIIKSLLDADTNNGEFYMLQIMYRGKDGASKFYNLEKKRNKSRIVKTYYVSSAEYLDKKKDEIIALCDLFNARATINLNKKSWKQIVGKSIEILGHCVLKEEWHDAKSVIESACGETGACDNNKSWLVDVDTKNLQELKKIENIINYHCKPDNTDKIIATIPTVHGFHLITRPFNPQMFKGIYQKEIDIHDNNPTLLYYNAVNEVENTDDGSQPYLQSYDGMYDSSFVDLGLPSGTLWAKTNICTKWETSYGGYYMWGQTNRYIEPDDAFYRKMSSEDFDKIQPEDDIVYTLMGRKWRLPTAEEFNELFVFTDHKFVKNYNDTGVNGMLFTSKLDSTKQIFLPAGGYMNDVVFCDDIVSGAYLTSSKNSLNAMVYAAFDANGGVNTWQGFYKYKYLVRGVTNK